MRRDVATSFLRRGSRYLVLRRSARVRTMRGMWSAVSGTIEPGEGALARAYAEILEETGLRPDSLELVSSAPPLAVCLAGGGALRVFGFIFEARSCEISLNWESSEYRWVTRPEIGSLESVPRLGDVLDALL